MFAHISMEESVGARVNPHPPATEPTLVVTILHGYPCSIHAVSRTVHKIIQDSQQQIRASSLRLLSPHLGLIPPPHSAPSAAPRGKPAWSL